MQVAIVGMAGRFPKSPTAEAFWRNLLQGVEGLDRFTPEEMLAGGVDPGFFGRDGHVPAGGVVEGIRTFDSDFFGYTPREAVLLDPQQRLLLECAWEALEDAGHAPSRFRGRIGVFTGLGINTYLLHNLGALDPGEHFLAFLGNDKDFGATRISYKLNLRGPSLSVQTACSSSLVAVHLACQSLLLGECDLALAGGSSVRLPQRAGYLYQKDGIESPDGHCRPFDAAAAGTVFADGAGLVALRRLEDALADGDHVRAVIRGSAVNNDGASKVGFTAPSFQGQVQAVAEALAMAEVAPGSLAFIEAHGTGTALGDSVEVQALARVFGSSARRRSCALGSLKSSVGHLDTASGVAGLIKATRALEERVLPPTLHFRQPHPELRLESGPFFVNTEPHRLQSAGGPLRAGVSSFGIGGTNAHAVLEEAPAAAASPARRAAQLLVVSARSRTARDRAVERLGEALRERPELPLADVAWTLQVGREEFPHRAAVVADRTDRAAGALADPDAVETGEVPEGPAGPLCFLFPGQGAQHPGMGQGLYAAEPVFAETLDHAAEVLRPLLGRDLISLLYSPSGESAANSPDTERLEQTEVAQPALFAVEYALVRLLRSWGLTPGLLLGHSVGEYVAACVAGVFSFEDGLRLMAARGRLVQALPPGAMIAVRLTEAQVRPWLSSGIALAAVNGPEDCVLSGETAAVRRCAEGLEAAGNAVRPLRTSHAFHSAMMEPALAAFAAELTRVRLQPPSLPVVSNFTGQILSAAEAVDPGYWCRHLRHTVRFAAGLETVLAHPRATLLEAGPGQGLGALARRHPARRQEHLLTAAMRHPRDPQGDDAFLLHTAGRLWLSGRELDWSGLHPGERRRRVPLPAYPFERRTHWIEPRIEARRDAVAGGPAAAELWVPSWKRRDAAPAAPRPAEGVWLVLADGPLAGPLSAALAEHGGTPVTVGRGEGWRWVGPDRFEIDPRSVDPWRELVRAAVPAGVALAGAVYAWGVGPVEEDAGVVPAELLGLVHLLRALEERGNTAPLVLGVLADRLFDVTGDETVEPDRALLLGPFRSAAQELPHLRCLCLDLGDWEARPATVLRRAVADLLDPAAPPVQACRGSRSWVPTFEPAPVPKTDAAAVTLPGPHAYLITGGLGNVGLELAQALVELHAGSPVDLYLTGRSSLPDRSDWERALTEAPASVALRSRLERLLALERAGARLHPRRIDVSDKEGLRALVADIAGRHGRLEGVIHAAGVVDPGAFTPLAELDAPRCEIHLRPKVAGLRVLESALEGVAVGRFLVCSSISSHLGGVGYAAYAAANAWLDAFCRARSRPGHGRWLSVAWDAWQFAGPEAVPGLRELPGLEPAQGRAVLRRLLLGSEMLPGGEVVVSCGPLAPRLEAWEAAARSATVPVRPALSASTPAETAPLARLWAEVLGVERVAPERSFFAEGGSSLLALQLLSRLRRERGVDLSLRDFLERPTLRELEQAVVDFSGGTADGFEPIPRTQRDRPLPLSPAQQRLWLAELDEGARGAFHIAEALHLSGPLDIGALARSFQAIVERHEILRVRFVMCGGEPAQIAVPPEGEVMRCEPLSLPADADLRTALAPLAEAELGAPFDLASEPPLRVRLLALSPGEHVLLLTFHHAVADDWSVGVLLGELSALYRGFTAGEEPRLPELTVQYLDWTVWQRRPQHAEALQAEAAFWMRRLAGARPLALPADRVRAGARTYQGGYVPLAIPAEQAARLRDLGGHESASPFMVLLAAFKALLHALCGAEDVVVGTPVAGRKHPQLAPLVGYFINPVALRTGLGGDPTFRELVGRVREVTLEAEGHEEMPLEQVAAALRAAAGDAGGPLFQVWFTVLTHSTRRDFLPGIEARPLRLGPRPARFDLSLILEPEEVGFAGFLEYSSDLFEPASAARIAEGFRQLLSIALAAPDLQLSALSERLHEAEERTRTKRRTASLATVRRKTAAVDRLG